MEKEEDNKFKKEYIRIKKFCKDNKILIFLIILLVLVNVIKIANVVE